MHFIEMVIAFRGMFKELHAIVLPTNVAIASLAFHTIASIDSNNEHTALGALSRAFLN